MSGNMVINCDLGESFGIWRTGNDADVMPLIDAANIACGYHAGDPTVIRHTLTLAVEYGVAIGAHVSYPDLQGFGRRSMAIRGQSLTDLIHYQIGALDGMARVAGTTVSYVKPHGAMYNDMTADPTLLDEIAAAVASWHQPLALVAMADVGKDSARELAARHGIVVKQEAFADRAYTDEGALMPRATPGAVLPEAEAAQQALAIVEGRLISAHGKHLALAADTICVHGDTPDALSIIRSVRRALDRR